MSAVLEWLLANGGPVIRFRTLTELHPDPPSHNTLELVAEILSSPKIVSWLQLHPSTFPGSPFGIHGSKRVLYENYVPKMIQFGLNVSVDHINTYQSFFNSKIDLSIDWGVLNLLKSAYTSFSIQFGIKDDRNISFLVQRLEQIYGFVKRKSFDIYDDPTKYPSMPSSMRGRPLLNPNLYLDNIIPVPTIYDVLAAKSLYKTSYIKLDYIKAIIEYIFDPQFQSLHPGFGIYYNSKNKRFYAHGWKPHLENFSSETSSVRNKSLFLLQLWIFSHFPFIHSQKWFKRGLKVLESYKTDRGTIILPKGFLEEKHSGYWVNGAYMGLGESRKARIWQELESTFWFLSILKNFHSKQ